MVSSFNKVILPVTTILMAVLAVVFIRAVPGFDGLYGQDAYEYLRYSKTLKTFMMDGTDPEDYFWPVWYPLTGALVSFVVQDVGLALQLISVLSLALVFIFINKIVLFIFPSSNLRSSISFNLLFIVFSPFVLRFAFLVMSDMLTLSFIIMSTYYLLKAGNGSTGNLILGGLMATLACMTRYAAFVIITPVAVYGYWMFFRNSKNAFNAIPAFILAVLPVIPHILIRGSQSASFLQHDWISQWSMVNFLKNDFNTRDGYTHYTFPNILYAIGGLFHPRYCFAGLIILIAGLKKIRLTVELKVIGTGLILYLFFLAGLPNQNNRFLLIALPYFALFLTQPWLTFMQKQNRMVRSGIVAIILVLQLGLFSFGFKPVYERNKFERDVYTYLQVQDSPDVYTVDVDISLKGRGYNGTLYNIYINYYDDPDTNALVIFNALTMPVQWNGMNPMKNWQHFNHKYQLIEIKRFENGWTVHKFN